MAELFNFEPKMQSFQKVFLIIYLFFKTLNFGFKIQNSKISEGGGGVCQAPPNRGGGTCRREFLNFGLF
jgi:hypothetical protein